MRLPPKRWYDRLADWMTRTATGLQAAPVAACLLLVAGAGLGSLGGYEFAARHAAGSLAANGPVRRRRPGGTDAESPPRRLRRERSPTSPASSAAQLQSGAGALQPGGAAQVEGTLDNPQIRQLLMLASQNGANPDVRDNSVDLLAAECRSGHGCEGRGCRAPAFAMR
jgi:hypothetical protein